MQGCIIQVLHSLFMYLYKHDKPHLSKRKDMLCRVTHCTSSAMLGWPGDGETTYQLPEKMLPLYRCPSPVASACVVTVTFSSSAASTYELFSSDSTGRWSFPMSYTNTLYSSEGIPVTAIFKSELDVFLLLATTNTSWDELLLEHRIDRYPLAVEFSEKLQLMLIVPGLEQLVAAHAWASWVPKYREVNIHIYT